MPRPIDELKRERARKLEKIKKLGVNPFPSSFDRSHSVSEVLGLKLGSKVSTAGRITSFRRHGAIIFADLRDESGKIQLCFRNNQQSSQTPSGQGSGRGVGAIDSQLLALLDPGDFLGVSGKTFKTKAGERTIEVSDFTLLAKSLRPLPSKWHGLKDVEERYRKRYLDLLMNSEARKVFEARTKILRLLRDYLDEHGFLEVETPVLQPLYGGASARPFVTHLNALDTDFYLRISDELYLKRLIVGGFEKVYEISKDFRNEGVDRQHSPEFTMAEFYWAYADYEDLMEFTEKMLSRIVSEVRGGLKVEFEGQTLDFTPPWPRISYRDLLLEYTGVDIDETRTVEALRRVVSEKGLDLDLSGAVGYGAALDAFYKEFCRPKVVQPTFLIDHPAELMPLAKRKADDPSRIESAQLLVSGHEIIKAYSELNDPVDQRKRWLEQEGLAKKGLEEHEVLDEDYIEALEYGMPPTAGWGMGIDRFSAILTNQHTIRDVILFPLMRPK